MVGGWLTPNWIRGGICGRKPGLKCSPALLALLLALAVGGISDPSQAQSTAGIERIQEQQQNVETLRDSLRGNIAQTTSLIEAFQSGQVSDAYIAIENVFGSIERATLDVLSSIDRNSEFQDAIDAMRAEIDTLIDRNMMEPPSAARDARLARLQDQRRRYHQQYDEVVAMQGSLMDRLRVNDEVRRTLTLDTQVDQVEVIVTALERVVGDLSMLDEELGRISGAVYESPSVVQQ